MPTNNDGLPDGTVIVPVPATCPELADIYNAPSCAFPHDLIYIPMDIRFLPETGGELWWWLLGVGVLLLIMGGIVATLPIAVEKARRRAEKP